MTKPTMWLCAQQRLRSAWTSPVWSESSLSTWRKLESLATHWVHSKDADQTGRMPRLIWVFAGHMLTLLVLSWGGSYEHCHEIMALFVLCKLIAQPSSGARDLIFGWTLVYNTSCANSKGFGETAQMCRLTWSFAGRLCDKSTMILWAGSYANNWAMSLGKPAFWVVRPGKTYM